MQNTTVVPFISPEARKAATIAEFSFFEKMKLIAALDCVNNCPIFANCALHAEAVSAIKADDFHDQSFTEIAACLHQRRTIRKAAIGGASNV